MSAATIPRQFLVFDVESIGLQGPAFAVGFVVVGEDGVEIDGDWRSCSIDGFLAPLDSTQWNKDLVWLEKNVPENVLRPSIVSCVTRSALQAWFIEIVHNWRIASLVVDCGYPVKVNWLLQCGLNPYPLHEVATARLLTTRDPIGEDARLPNELPKHHPLMDARQSARIFLKCLSECSR